MKKGPERADLEDLALALDRLDFQGGTAEEILEGPPVDPVVSGRAGSAGGPFLSSAAPTSAHDLGLLLDEELLEELMLAEDAGGAMPAEALLGEVLWDESLGRDPRINYAEAVQTEDGTPRETAEEEEDWAGATVEIPAARFLAEELAARRPIADGPGSADGASAVSRSSLGDAAQIRAHARAVPPPRKATPTAHAPSLPAFIAEPPLAQRARARHGDLRTLAPKRSFGSAQRRATPLPSGTYAAHPRAQEPSVTPRRAALASLIVPGWGQSLNGEKKKAWIYRALGLCGPLAIGSWFTTRIWPRLPSSSGGTPGATSAAAHAALPGLFGAGHPAAAPPIWLIAACALGVVVSLLSSYDALVVRSCLRRLRGC